MTFDRPAWLLALLTLPLVLAWLGRRGPRHVQPWPSLRFLPPAEDALRERRGIAWPPFWVLAAVLSLALLVVGAAGPRSRGAHGDGRLTVVFDVTASMAWRDARGAERWQRALDGLRAELAVLPPDVEVAWHTMPDRGEVRRTRAADGVDAALEAFLRPRPDGVDPEAAGVRPADGATSWLLVTDRPAAPWPPGARVRTATSSGGTNAGFVAARLEPGGDRLWLTAHLAGDAEREVWIEDGRGALLAGRVRLRPGSFHAFALAEGERIENVVLRTDGADALSLDDRVQRHASGLWLTRIDVPSPTLARALGAIPGLLLVGAGEAADLVVSGDGVGVDARDGGVGRVWLAPPDAAFREGILAAADVAERETFAQLEPLALRVHALEEPGGRALFAARLEDGRVVPVVTLRGRIVRIGLALEDLEAHRGRVHVPLLFALTIEALRAALQPPVFERPVAETPGREVGVNLLALAETACTGTEDEASEGEASLALEVPPSPGTTHERACLWGALVAWSMGPLAHVWRRRSRAVRVRGQARST